MVFPLGDDNSDRTMFPVVNVCLIVVNVLVFVLLQGFGTNDSFTLAFSAVPAEIVSGRDVVTEDQQVQFQTKNGPAIVTVPGLKRTPIPVFLTLLTSIFMHGGLAHLAGNMWYLAIFGDNIEDRLGHVGFLLFYLLAGLVAAALHVAFNPGSEVPTVGASGAIAGVLGAYLVAFPRARVVTLVPLFPFFQVMALPAVLVLGFWIVMQFFSGALALGYGGGGVAWWAHVGGFTFGVVIMWFMRGGRRRAPALER